MKFANNNTNLLSNTLAALAIAAMTLAFTATNSTFASDQAESTPAAEQLTPAESALMALDHLVVELENTRSADDLTARIAWIESMVKIGHYDSAGCPSPGRRESVVQRRCLPRRRRSPDWRYPIPGW